MTQQTFLSHVPAFRECGDYTWQSLQGILATTQADLLSDLGARAASPAGIAPPAGIDDALLSRAVALEAARRAIPQLNLILDANGFAVVSNQNLSPASRERTAALRHQLRHEASDARDRLHDHLLAHGLIPQPHTLLPHATLARRYGITLGAQAASLGARAASPASGAASPASAASPLCHDEYTILQPHLAAAEHRLAHLISPAQHRALLAFAYPSPEAQAADTAAALSHLLHLSRQYLAADIRAQLAPSTDTVPHATERTAARSLKELLLAERDNPAYTPYRNSPTYRADTATPYRNQAHDPTYFFA